MNLIIYLSNRCIMRKCVDFFCELFQDHCTYIGKIKCGAMLVKGNYRALHFI